MECSCEVEGFLDPRCFGRGMCGKANNMKAPRCIPDQPDRDGHHWVRRYRGGPAIPLAWFALWHANAGRGWGAWCEPDREDQWEYLGPCIEPKVRDELIASLKDIEFVVDGKEDADDGIPNDAMKIMAVVQTALRSLVPSNRP